MLKRLLEDEKLKSTIVHDHRHQHYAAKNGNDKVLNILLQIHSDTESKSTDGRNALHYSAQHGHEKCLLLLIEKGANKEALTNLG